MRKGYFDDEWSDGVNSFWVRYHLHMYEDGEIVVDRVEILEGPGKGEYFGPLDEKIIIPPDEKIHWEE